MADRLPLLAAETGTYATTSPNPHVNLSGTAANFGTYPVRTFAQAAADTAVDFDSGHPCTVTIWKDASNFARYSGAVWTDATPDTIDLSAATLESSLGTLSNNDSVTVAAGDLLQTLTPTEYDIGNSGSSKTIDPKNGRYQKMTLNAACTVTLTNPASGKAGSLVLRWTVSGGAYAITWPVSGFAWLTGAAPTFGTANGNKNIAIAIYGADGWIADGGPCQ